MTYAVDCGLRVPAADRELLTSWTRSPSVRAGLAQRALVVLLAADDVGTKQIVRDICNISDGKYWL